MADPQSMEPLDHAPRAETAADIRLEMDATRRRLSDTLAELDDRVEAATEGPREQVRQVRDQVAGVGLDIAGFIREQPLTAALIALGVGIAVAVSGSDRAVAGAAADGARTAGRAASDAASDLSDAARERLAERLAERRARRAAERAARPGRAERLQRKLAEKLQAQLAEAMDGMRASAARLADDVVLQRAARIAEERAMAQAATAAESSPEMMVPSPPLSVL